MPTSGDVQSLPPAAAAPATAEDVQSLTSALTEDVQSLPSETTEDVQAEEVHPTDIMAQLQEQYSDIAISRVIIADVVSNATDKLVCRSTFNSQDKGIGWAGHKYTAGGSGHTYDTNNPAPQPCFNCDGPHWRRNCPFGN